MELDNHETNDRRDRAIDDRALFVTAASEIIIDCRRKRAAREQKEERYNDTHRHSVARRHEP
jgi:hypothetical protein